MDKTELTKRVGSDAQRFTNEASSGKRQEFRKGKNRQKFRKGSNKQEFRTESNRQEFR